MVSTTAPPSLIDEQTAEEATNTLALLLPHLSLFAPPILDLLKDHYSTYGPLAHWAPVKGFGRVILVYEENEDAARAKREGDWLHLDVNIPEQAENGTEYFKKRRQGYVPSHSLS
jgi:calcipressin-2